MGNLVMSAIVKGHQAREHPAEDREGRGHRGQAGRPGHVLRNRVCSFPRALDHAPVPPDWCPPLTPSVLLFTPQGDGPGHASLQVWGHRVLPCQVGAPVTHHSDVVTSSSCCWGGCAEQGTQGVQGEPEGAGGRSVQVHGGGGRGQPWLHVPHAPRLEHLPQLPQARVARSVEPRSV
jgi:hypothetical protein